MSPSGFLLIDKPPGPTSHDIVDHARRVIGIRRIGHAGTLDPFASGLLILGIGTTTKRLSLLVGLDKIYETTIVFGAQSDTDDRTGTITQTSKPLPDEATIAQTVHTFKGTIEQIPPIYSAIKVQGQTLYRAARAGHPIQAAPRKVSIFEWDILSCESDANLNVHHFESSIHCSSGTYIRALARDIGTILKCGGYVEELRRISIGPFGVSEAISLESLQTEWKSHLLSEENILSRLPVSHL
ncbi:MAG: tRNA pseudouridine synthase B [Candidatus Uhrbacteria bacterium GW2011_GWF2_41_16]|jgi:tRNA pseudouridine55 synthase|uniref:tRNA pseudouridine synthase B n=2 Tax=Candidatus Uhriibacteriota TaxID=1752732 RepID=A0A0G0VCV0_9BACT|nr:MAG: tRNA pseudouridine synthase B [Candidatus Uhrbacteria bacterium GW2011_GWA2_41_10]KKR87750.1 MAG: tRNA pseudouridine synthase B [Candidatus Uhrbacteria bacterium GW2011_GWC2_41_11]KKR98689.1 MAG: tRNA pseudouridine synthase B [Candidatus Uhrbacteria bacterium GW2011_GWF2_41_16]HBP00215.1 tRNA pseudouridine(55) synthase TruB [Candidatus Uhrbacteria bacterium]